LFGSDDLLGSDRFRHAVEMLSYVEAGVLATGGLRREELLPIARAMPARLSKRRNRAGS
jgi:hypothetical protein